MQLILASASPRRSDLLAGLGLAFEVAPSDVDETLLAGESPAGAACRLAAAKASASLRQQPNALVLAADTLVVLDGRVLGKPDDARQAVTMLTALRGREHLVHTGLAIGHAGKVALQLATSPVQMRAYGDDEIAAYVATGDPLDKAGAYACQHPEFHPVARYGNCYANVMGLPLCHVHRLLASMGLSTPRHPLQGCPWPATHGDCPWAAPILETTPDEWHLEAPRALTGA